MNFDIKPYNSYLKKNNKSSTQNAIEMCFSEETNAVHSYSGKLLSQLYYFYIGSMDTVYRK